MARITNNKVFNRQNCKNTTMKLDPRIAFLKEPIVIIAIAIIILITAISHPEFVFKYFVK
jgi:hypothetical protein